MRNIFLSVVIVAVLVAGGVGGTMARWIEDDTGDYCFDAGSLNLVIDIEGEEIDEDYIGDIFCATSIEPKNSGHTTLSFHVYADPSDNQFATLNVTATCTDQENSSLEPEVTASDNVSTGPFDDGELDEFLVMFLWWDNGIDEVPGTEDEGEGDNVWQECEDIIFCGTFADLLDESGVIADLDVCTVYYIGISWVLADYGVSYCGGTVTPSPNDEVNKCMTDSLSGTITFGIKGPFPKPN